MNAPEMKAVWNAESPRLALAEARRITRKIGADKQTQFLKDALDKERQKLRQELGLDSVDTGASAGLAGKRIYTVAELENRSFVRKHLKDIQLAQEEGRIKE